MKKWSLREDYIVCQYTYERIFKNGVVEPPHYLMQELQEKGFDPRSEVAVQKRIRNYLTLFEGKQSPYITSQVFSTYYAFMDRINNPARHENIKKYIAQNFDPNCISTASIETDSLLLFLETEQNALHHYLHKIEYSSTLPMVLQKFIDQKGFKKHKDIYNTISMKQDTFSSILRGKYTVVKKENVLRLCIGLKLSIEEAEELMESAGYLFSRGIMTDVVVKAHIIHQCYDPETIDNELDENHVATLFSLA